MKKAIFLVALSFSIKAQNPSINNTVTVKDSLIESIASAKERLEAIRQKVLSGQSSMADMARLYSQDPGSAKNGGLLLNVTRGKMVPAFETVAFSMQEGEISEVFQTPYGYHFIQLLEWNKEAANLRHILLSDKR